MHDRGSELAEEGVELSPESPDADLRPVHRDDVSSHRLEPLPEIIEVLHADDGVSIAWARQRGDEIDESVLQSAGPSGRRQKIETCPKEIFEPSSARNLTEA